MSFKDSDARRKKYLENLTVPIVINNPERWSQDKILCYSDRIEKLKSWWQDRDNPQPGPVTMGFHIDNRCNENCPNCSGWRSLIGSNLSVPYEVAQWVIDEGYEMGVEGIQFSGGGEPWMHPRATDMLLYAKNKGIKVGVISNGTAFTEKDCRILGQECLWIRISFDAGSPEIRKISHGVDRWDRLIKNCKLIQSNANDELVLGGAFLVSDITIVDAQKFIDLCEDLGFTYVQFRPYQLLEGDWYADHLDKAVHDVVVANQNRTIKVVASGWRRERKDFCRGYSYCFGAHFRCELNADSGIYPCCHLAAEKHNAWGFIKKPGDFTKIIQEKNMDKIDVSRCTEHCIYNQMNERLVKFFKNYPHKEFLG